MRSQTQRQNIRERSNIIYIDQTLNTTLKTDLIKGEYSLKQNFFDPSKSSPPNEFMAKLHMRMNMYHRDNKEDNLVIE
jgi:hypothetical protein